MATTIVSNLVIFSDGTGHGNQSHLIFTIKQQRWWLFIVKTKTATVVSCYVSSSADLTTATWSAGTDSPAFPSSRACSANDQRNLAVTYLRPSNAADTDAAHVSVGIAPNATTGMDGENIRATFTGANSISWESWNDTSGGTTAVTDTIRGNALGISRTGFIHESMCQGFTNNNNSLARLSTNADLTASWTNGFGAVNTVEVIANTVNSYAYAPLGGDSMVVVYDNGGAASPNCTGLRSNKYTSGTTWPTSGAIDVGIGTSTQDQNDWCLCSVDTNHNYAVRRDTASTYLWRKYDGTSWSTPTNTVPSQAHKATSGIFLCTNGTDFWMFVLDSASNNPLMYNKCSNAYGSTPSWSGWTQLEPADTAARNSISGCPYVGNNQIGIIYTRVNGSNFDILVTALKLDSNVPTAGTRTRTRSAQSKRYRPR